jgi:cysteine desulfurase family protein (TIGR01976 family)
MILTEYQEFMQANELKSIRSRFPALSRMKNGHPVIFLDGPAGTQVPQSVVDRVSECMLHHNANRSGRFDTSREIDQIMTESHQAMADFLGAEHWQSIAFGPNMTSLTLQISRALAQEWQPGDEVMVTSLDHDANFSPWVLAARDRGVTVRVVEIHREDATLDMSSLESMLNSKTRLVAVTAASNAVGSLTPIREIADRVHAVGAELFVDAVHYAPHKSIDVKAWDCDFLVCSAYKFFGPHIGVLYGRTDRMDELTPYKLRPAPDSLPGKWMTGTQNHACIAGAAAAVDYIASLSEPSAKGSRRDRLVNAMNRIESHESTLVQQLICGLKQMPWIRLFGIVDETRSSERAPTIAFQVQGQSSAQAAERLGELGIFAWHGNYYALPLTQALGTEPEGMVRLGCMHYNTPDEIDRTLHAIEQLRDGNA